MAAPTPSLWLRVCCHALALRVLLSLLRALWPRPSPLPLKHTRPFQVLLLLMLWQRLFPVCCCACRGRTRSQFAVARAVAAPLPGLFWPRPFPICCCACCGRAPSSSVVCAVTAAPQAPCCAVCGRALSQFVVACAVRARCRSFYSISNNINYFFF